MIIQISDDDSIILRCHTFDNMPEMQDFFIKIKENHLCICRNAGQEMKVHLLDDSKELLGGKKMKEDILGAIKLKPLKKRFALIKLEKEK